MHLCNPRLLKIKLFFLFSYFLSYIFGLIGVFVEHAKQYQVRVQSTLNPPVLQFKGLAWNLLATNEMKRKLQSKQNKTKQNFNSCNYSRG
jgi:hypothetical protein